MSMKPTWSVLSMVSPSGAVAVMVFAMRTDAGKIVSFVSRLKTLEFTCGKSGPSQPAELARSSPSTSNGVWVTCERKARP